MGVNHRYNLDMSSVRVTGVQKTLLLHVTLVLYFYTTIILNNLPQHFVFSNYSSKWGVYSGSSTINLSNYNDDCMVAP